MSGMIFNATSDMKDHSGFVIRMILGSAHSKQCPRDELAKRVNKCQTLHRHSRPYPATTPQPPLAPPGPSVPSGKANKPFYKRKLVWFLGVVVLIIVIFAANSSKSSTTTPAASDSGSSVPAEAAATEPGVGTAVRDGKFEFVVTSVEPGTPEIGQAPLTTKAQGQFVVVNVSVSNIVNEPQSFSGSNAKAFDSQGREFTADSSAAIYLQDSNSLYTPINPGNSVTGKVVFDIPAGAQLTSIELKDSPFSGGVTVKL